MNKAPASARMGCALNPEQLRTEPCSKHKDTLTRQKERERSWVSFQSLRAVILLCAVHVLLVEQPMKDILDCSGVKAAIWLRCSRIQQ